MTRRTRTQTADHKARNGKPSGLSPVEALGALRRVTEDRALSPAQTRVVAAGQAAIERGGA